MELHFKDEGGKLYVKHNNEWLLVDTDGSGEFTQGDYIYSYKYNQGLLISAVIVSKNDDYSEVLEFEEGMLRSRYINGKTYHYLHNVFLGETVQGSVTNIIMRDRIRGVITHTSNDVKYDIIDDKFFWLLQLDQSYLPYASLNAPFTFDTYFTFYQSTLVEPMDVKEYDINGVKWTTVDTFIDGVVSYGDRYNAIVTKSYMEEETIDQTRYVYNEGKVLKKILINDIEQYVKNGVLNNSSYINGFMRNYPINTMYNRSNIPESDVSDSVRRHVRSVLPWFTFK